MSEKLISMSQFLARQLLYNVENLTTAQVVEKMRASARLSRGKHAEVVNKMADVLEEQERLPEEQKDHRKAIMTICEIYLQGVDK